MATQVNKAQSTPAYAPREDALYLTATGNQYGHLAKVVAGSPAAEAFIALGEILASGKAVDINVRPSRSEAGSMTLRLTVNDWKPAVSQTSTAQQLRAKFLAKKS